MLPFSSLWAQDSVSYKSNSIQYNIGLNQVKENNLVPVVHRGVLHYLCYENQQQQNNVLDFRVSLLYSSLVTKHEDDGDSFNAQINLSCKYLFTAIQTGNFSWFSGPSSSLHYSLSEYSNYDESHLYWADYLSINISNYLQYRWGHNKYLAWKISFPVCMFLCRPEINRAYKIDDVTFKGIVRNMHSDPEFAFWGKGFSLNSELEYRWNDRPHSPSFVYSVDSGWFFPLCAHLFQLRSSCSLLQTTDS